MIGHHARRRRERLVRMRVDHDPRVVVGAGVRVVGGQGVAGRREALEDDVIANKEMSDDPRGRPHNRIHEVTKARPHDLLAQVETAVAS